MFVGCCRDCDYGTSSIFCTVTSLSFHHVCRSPSPDDSANSHDTKPASATYCASIPTPSTASTPSCTTSAAPGTTTTAPPSRDASTPASTSSAPASTSTAPCTTSTATVLQPTAGCVSNSCCLSNLVLHYCTTGLLQPDISHQCQNIFYIYMYVYNI